MEILTNRNPYLIQLKHSQYNLKKGMKIEVDYLYPHIISNLLIWVSAISQKQIPTQHA